MGHIYWKKGQNTIVFTAFIVLVTPPSYELTHTTVFY